MRTPTLLQLAAYGIYLPTFAVSPKLAKETVYMPSHVAAQVLGGKVDQAEKVPERVGG